MIMRVRRAGVVISTNSWLNMPEGRLARLPRQAPSRNPADPQTLESQELWESAMKTYDPHKSTTELRQGNARKMNSRVLAMSLIGVVFAFVVIYIIYSIAMPAPTN